MLILYGSAVKSRNDLGRLYLYLKSQSSLSTDSGKIVEL